jgi:charged multivesicular body protein 2A
MGNLFSEPKSLRQIAREQRRVIDRAMRELKRQNEKVARDEEALIAEMKVAARDHRVATVKIMALDLVRLRNQRHQSTVTTGTLRAVNMKLSGMVSTAVVTETLDTVGKAMGQANKEFDQSRIQDVARQFTKQSQMLDVKSEMFADTIEDMDEIEDEEESDAIVNQILDEIGINFGHQLGEPHPRRQYQPPIEASMEADRVALESRCSPGMLPVSGEREANQ